jgi:hypothetical protein
VTWLPRTLASIPAWYFCILCGQCPCSPAFILVRCCGVSDRCGRGTNPSLPSMCALTPHPPFHLPPPEIATRIATMPCRATTVVEPSASLASTLGTSGARCPCLPRRRKSCGATTEAMAGAMEG